MSATQDTRVHLRRAPVARLSGGEGSSDEGYRETLCALSVAGYSNDKESSEWPSDIAENASTLDANITAYLLATTLPNLG